MKLLKGEEHEVFCLSLPGVGSSSTGPPVPPARGGLQGGNGPAASSTDTAASPSLGKGGQMDQDPHGLMESQALAGLAQCFLPFPAA